MLDEHRLGHYGTGAAGTGEPGDGCQQMQKKDSQIAHRTMLPSPRHRRRMLGNFEFATHTVKRDWRLAKMWLLRELAGQRDE